MLEMQVSALSRRFEMFSDRSITHLCASVRRVMVSTTLGAACLLAVASPFFLLVLAFSCPSVSGTLCMFSFV